MPLVPSPVRHVCPSPIECVRVLLSPMTSRAGLYGNAEQRLGVPMSWTSRGHPQNHQHRAVYTELPKEHPASSDTTKCGELSMTLFGGPKVEKHIELVAFEICAVTEGHHWSSPRRQGPRQLGPTRLRPQGERDPRVHSPNTSPSFTTRVNLQSSTCLMFDRCTLVELSMCICMET